MNKHLNGTQPNARSSLTWRSNKPALRHQTHVILRNCISEDNFSLQKCFSCSEDTTENRTHKMATTRRVTAVDVTKPPLPPPRRRRVSFTAPLDSRPKKYLQGHPLPRAPHDAIPKTL